MAGETPRTCSSNNEAGVRLNRRINVVLTCTLALLVAALGDLRAQTPEVVVQSGHTARVTALAADPQRALVATASNDNTVRLWRILPPSDGTLLRVLAGHTDFVTDVTFNVNDPTQIASCAIDRTIRFWQIATGTSRSILLEDVPQTLAFRHSSNIVAVGFQRRAAIAFYDANTGKETDRPISLSAPATKIAYGARGDVIYCGLSNGHVEAFDARTKNRLGSWQAGSSRVLSVFESNDRLTVVTEDGGVLIKRRRSDPIIHQLDAEVTAAAAAITQDTVLITTVDAELIHLAVMTGRKRTESITAKQIDAVVQASDGTTLLYGERDAQLYAWWIARPGAHEFTVQSTGAVQQAALALAPSGAFLAVGDDHGTLTVYALDRAMTPLRFDNLGFRKIAAVAFSADGSQLFVGGFGSTWLVALDTKTWQRSLTMDGKRSVSAICAGSDFVAVLDERREELLHLVKRDGSLTLDVEVRGVTHAAISSDRQWITALSSNQGVLINASTGHITEKGALSFDRPISAVGVNDRGTEVYAGTREGGLVVIDPSGWRVTKTLPGLHDGAIVDIDVLQETLLTAGTDGAINRWVAETLRSDTPPAYSEHVGQLRMVDVDESATIIASCAADGRVILRYEDSVQRNRTIVPVGHEWIVFDAEGRYDASVRGSEYVRIIRGLDVLPIERFRAELYRPLILTSSYRDTVPTAMTAVVEAAPEPPHVNIHAPAVAGAITDSMVMIDVDVVAPKAGSVIKLDLYVNGKYLERRTHRAVEAGRSTVSLRVPLASDTNRINVVPVDEQGQGTADRIVLVRAPIEIDRAPRAYILAVGINAYRNPMYDLVFAKDDAVSMVETLQRSIPDAMEAEVIQLLDERATIADVIGALNRIESEARPDDAVIFYYAGHGAVLRTADGGGEYCFALHGVADINDASILQREALFGDTLRSYLLRIRARRQAVIIDACYSGMMLESFTEVENAQYVSELQRSTGATVLASVLPNKRAKEVAELRHGVFTYALLEGLNGAAQDRDGDVTILSLLNYIAKSMPALGQRFGIELLQPVIRFEGAAQTLVLASQQG